MISTNLSVLLAREGLNVVLLDADFGLANAHLLMGLDPTDDISSVISGEKSFTDIMVEGPEGVKLIPGGSGLSELTHLGDDKFSQLVNELADLETLADIMIVDLPAGISPQVMALLGAAHDMILVVTPEVTSLVDAYAMIKALSRMNDKVAVHIIVNRAPDKSRAIVGFQKLHSVVNKHLEGRVSLKFMGWIPQNWYVLNSVASRKPIVLRHPQCFATQCLEGMAEKLFKRNTHWRDQQSRNPVYPSYFDRLEKMIYGR
jgi:flagellar biosynthesis protein FlhG